MPFESGSLPDDVLHHSDQQRHGTLVLQIDMLNPKLREYAATGALAHAQNYSRSILLGFLWSIFFTALFILFYIDKTSTVALRNLR